jgi:hypothetical protein
MITRETAQKALEALELAENYSDHPEYERSMTNAIAALKAELAAPVEDEPQPAGVVMGFTDEGKAIVDHDCERGDALEVGDCLYAAPIAAQAGETPAEPQHRVHLEHCYQGEFEQSCKYGDDDCPAAVNAEPQDDCYVCGGPPGAMCPDHKACFPPPAECEVDPVSSRACELGTRGCVVAHVLQAPALPALVGRADDLRRKLAALPSRQFEALGGTWATYVHQGLMLDAVDEYRAALAAPPQHEGEIVVTKNEAGQIVCVTRQDEEGRILKVLSESAVVPEHPALREARNVLREREKAKAAQATHSAQGRRRRNDMKGWWLWTVSNAIGLAISIYALWRTF